MSEPTTTTGGDPAERRQARSRKTVESLLTDASVPLEMRFQVLRQVCAGDGEAERKVAGSVLESAAAARADEHSIAKTKELGEILQQLQQPPPRCATFDRMLESAVLGRRAQVILPDGGLAFCSVPDPGHAGSLRCGDTVWLDAQAGVVLDCRAQRGMLGEEARLERRLPQGDVEVSIGDHARHVFRAAADLLDQLEGGEAAPGSTVVVCPRRMIAWRALPPRAGEAHLRFLSREPLPDVVVERDIGAPPDFIEQISRHVRREMHRPELGRRFGLRRSRMVLAAGVAGSGKTLSIEGLERRLYEVMAEETGVAVEELPRRVFRLRAAEVLSKWLGESDQNIDRFFDEVGQVASDPFVAPNGREWELPVLVVCEEIDALARRRGDDAIHDRIENTLLSRLDPGRSIFRHRVVIVVCTTNLPSALDVAFVRRAGGTVERFGRVDRRSFRAVLAKHLRARPFADGEAGAARATAELTSWLFSPHASDGEMVELTYVGRANHELRHRRDFVTAGLVDRAVQQAAGEACDEEWQSGERAWLSGERLMRAIDAQVRSIVDQLTPENCEQYLSLPDAARVATVRRIPRPAALPVELQRVS